MDRNSLLEEGKQGWPVLCGCHIIGIIVVCLWELHPGDQAVFAAPKLLVQCTHVCRWHNLILHDTTERAQGLDGQDAVYRKCWPPTCVHHDSVAYC